MSIKEPKILDCRKCGIEPIKNVIQELDPLRGDTWFAYCTGCGISITATSPEELVHKWNEFNEDDSLIVLTAVHDIESILRAAEGRYTFICRFCAHYKTKDCCDKDGKCNPEWRGIQETEE